ncbi:MAG: hypothetical protein U9R79_09900, partial [Armatimonadota bacterium]|nr:hypothetical protein [Armatimonadota bacterium]
GMGLGSGLLIGAVAGVYASIEASRSWASSGWLARAIGLISTAAAGPALVLILFAASPTVPLVGFALSAVLAALLWRLCLAPMGAREEATDSPAVLGVEIFALVAVAGALGARLGLEHFGGSDAAEAYWPLPVLLVASAGLGAMIPSTLASADDEGDVGLREALIALVATLLPVLVALMLAWKLFGQWSPLLVVLTGAVGMGMAAWLAAETGAEEGRPALEAFALGLVALAMVAVAFKVLHGYGEALALAAGVAPLAVIGSAAARKRRGLAAPLLVGSFTIVVLLAAYRMVLETTGGHQAVDLEEHYVYFGLIVGALAVLGLVAQGAGSWRAAAEAGDPLDALRRMMARAPLPMLGVALLPAAMLAVWGQGALQGLLVGLVVGELVWMVLAAWSTDRDRAVCLAAAPHAALVGAALVALQLGPIVAGLGPISRAVKAGVVVAIALVAAVWIAVRTTLARAEALQGGGDGDA